MKKIQMLFCFLLLCVGFAGCGTEPAAETEAPAADTWGLTLSAENVTPTGLTLLCKQSGGNPSGELQTGSYFVIEQKTENGWEEVPLLTEEAAWTEEAYPIPKEKTTAFEKTWEFLYGELPSGTYRMGISVMDFRKTGDFDKKMYYAEFETE